MKPLLIAALIAGVVGSVPAYANSQKIQLAPESSDSWKETVSVPAVAASTTTPDAQPIISSLRFCGAIADRDGRLSCYDDIASHNGIAVNQADTTRPVAQWIIKENSGSEDYIAGLSSGQVIAENGDKMPQPVVLYFRCSRGVPTIYFKPGGVVGHEAIPVEFSEGNGNAGERVGRYSLRPSVSGDAFGVWNGDAVRNMVSYFSTVGGIRLSYHLQDAPRVSTRFDLSRFTQDTADIRRACRL